MDLSVLPRAGELSPHHARVPRWRPGLACSPHSEVFASGDEASGAALALALALDGLGEERAGRSFLWVQDKAALRLNGRPYRPGLPPALRGRLIHVCAAKPEDALFALEEGIRCRDLLCVIGEIAGNPRALDFTASRRLTLAAEKYGVPLLLVRHDAARDLSSARMRWQARAAPSLPPRWNAAAPGSPAWHAELFRARGHAPGEWILHDDDGQLAAPQEPGAPDHGDLADAAGGRSLAAS
jgi:protein ImuA